MKVTIEFKKKTVKKEQVLHLKQYIERCSINGIKKLEIAKKDAKQGEMAAGGVLTKLTAFLIGSGGPFTKLAEALVKYVENMRSDIRLVNENGQELVISAKLKKDDLSELIEQFFSEEKKAITKSTNKKRTTKKAKSTTRKTPVKSRKTKKTSN